MTSNSFQIIFEEADGKTYSATFDRTIGLDCKGKYVDVKGEVYDMNIWARKIHPDSTSLNVIHNARKANESSNCTDGGYNLCCADVSKCKNFFTTANMPEIATCCSPSFGDEVCAYCILQSEAINKLTIKKALGKAPTILKKDTNLVITDGINAALISLSKD